MRTTKTEFRIQVRQHVSECLEGHYMEDKVISLVDLMKEFKSWYGKYEQKRNPNKDEAFKEFLQGLPSMINLDFTYHEISKNLEKWFNVCGEDYKETPPEKEAQLYYHLVIKELKYICKLNNIEY